jgi:beta-lactamase regulating signal transducer with metallopeptidase domain
MIFAARGIVVSLAFFALLYTFLSLVLAFACRLFGSRQLSKQLPQDVLFMIRVAPACLSAAISLFLICPSFIELERRSMDEDLGTFVLGACALLLLGAGFFRVAVAERRTRQIVNACLEGAIELKDYDVQCATISPQTVAPLMLIGIRVPRIVISQSTRDILNDAELLVAVRHEAQHLRSRDNLKKAIFNFLPFPGMEPLERAWQDAAELAADRGAVSSGKEALDLAAALIKLTRHFPLQAMPEFATSLVSSGESATRRVEHLLAWEKTQDAPSKPWRSALVAAFLALIVVAVKFGPALALIHTITERLVP